MMSSKDRQKECRRCGYRWMSLTETPVRCPGCGTYHWEGEQTTYTCAVCDHTWFSRTTNLPQRCPSCKTRSWKNGPRKKERHCAPIHGRADRSEEIMGLYTSDNGCIAIARTLDIPLSTVIKTVKAKAPGEHSPRM